MISNNYLIKTQLSNLFSDILVCFSKFQRKSARHSRYFDSQNMTEEQLYSDFIANLEKIYGSFSKKQKKFKKASNSKIARELCYSDSQFSRLINNSASNGEYERAIQNTKRAINELYLQSKVGKEASSDVSFFTRLNLDTKKITLFSSSLLVAVILILVIFPPDSKNGTENPGISTIEKDSMLKYYFENSSVSPYIGLGDLPEDCSYPCYKYQGQWNLKNTYKIPVFRERNGFHYQAKDVNLYTRCLIQDTDDGKVLEGYEYQSHEIWYDTLERKFDTFIRDDDMSMKTDEYKELIFSESDEFVKVALVHTFFRNEFTIDSTTIERKGLVVGRDVEILSDDTLLNDLGEPERVEDIKREINSIIVNRLEDFSKPVSCKSSDVPDPNFHNISELDTMSFDCKLTTANAPISYTKTYVFNDQYIETSCRTNP